ncbi:sensor histidine kinase [Ruminococcus flavefaciens]|uniref:histidine kinase n=1 Tax=Ruminococcus flavefaciens TaxID=1265 RepID=A0A315YNQ3_RUMFL|nr:HAMP domain-containing sensor histidine kinase [Ruminococcus flavefaciens]PWJ13512.1 signal transduction histidine kinase [Ruminococcus flavefaciens]SSA48025.1 Signal transduction histidine kinase [Ruminococcus flavefaciens]
MKGFNRIIAAAVIIMAAVIIILDAVMLKSEKLSQPLYKVEVSRIERELSQGAQVSAGDYPHITGIYSYDGSPDFYSSDGEYLIREINGQLWRIDYTDSEPHSSGRTFVLMNVFLAAFAAAVIGILLYIRRSIIKPFNEISELPEKLSKGNLTIPLKEKKSRYFGRFIWGLDMLRQELEQSRQRELEYARNEKTFLLSLSHDIKTPLAAIKLYAKALSKGIYTTADKQRSAADSIDGKADEIEGIVKELSANLSSDFMDFDVRSGEFYLSEVMDEIKNYYTDKLSVTRTEFNIEKYSDCMLSGDPDRLVEVLQNIMENAVKYGDGRSISVSFSEEEDCRLITVANTGCTLPEEELPHIFDSFWRGSNTGSQSGSGLGLYICRRLMALMNGDIYADTALDTMKVTVVCRKPE